MSSAHGQHPIQQLTLYRPDPPFGYRVRAWRLHGRWQDSDAVGGEDRIEGVGELRVPVADKELKLPDVVFQVHEQVPGLWATHTPVGLVTPRT